MYAIHIEQLEARFHTETLGAYTMAAGGAEDVELPDMAAWRTRFDEWLVAPPVGAHPLTDEQNVRVALGLKI